jgi:uncharacterized protein (DUF433 family)
MAASIAFSFINALLNVPRGGLFASLLNQSSGTILSQIIETTMSSVLIPTSLIVQTSRGPSIAGRRTTVYVVLELVKRGLDRRLIAERLSLSDEQIDAALQYIEENRNEVESEYDAIVRLSEERQAYYDGIYQSRSRYATQPVEQRIAQMRRDLVKRRAARPPQDENQNPA